MKQISVSVNMQGKAELIFERQHITYPDEMKGGWAELTAELGPNAEQEEIKHHLFAQTFSFRRQRESTRPSCIRADFQLVKNIATLVHTPKEKRMVLVS